ncbi:hypothetical protein LV478_13575 [Komagataeibacter oboediens]|uniref:hypothetical protein n=1 Tax=Komagataeibacter oboediens TaxID=65958 RepID=UPI0023DC57D9|nr:hypothetical protein [Komagataeibacter oboediens]WEQ51540.1 hypothetical protein LV478_13575 [Komagataeibacter oboediens]
MIKDNKSVTRNFLWFQDVFQSGAQATSGGQRIDQRIPVVGCRLFSKRRHILKLAGADIAPASFRI